MFNNKIVLPLCRILGALLLLKALLVIVMFIWSYYGTPPVPIINAQAPGYAQYLVLLQELAVTAFWYLVLGYVYNFMLHAKKGHAVAATARKPARRTRRRTKK